MATTNIDPNGAIEPVVSIDTSDISPSFVSSPGSGDPLYRTGIPEPKGTDPTEEHRAGEGKNTDPTAGIGVEGELDVWQARYSNRNFIGRLFVRTVLTVGWMALAIYTWNGGHSDLVILTWIALAVVAVLWIALAFRMVQAHYSHFYRLTNRRLFLSTGIVNRRRDMMELLRVEDVFARQQSLLERWLSVGTVVVVPSQKDLPTFYLAGVYEPKEVMDLIWHHARAERDQRSIKVEDV